MGLISTSSSTFVTLGKLLKAFTFSFLQSGIQQACEAVGKVTEASLEYLVPCLMSANPQHHLTLLLSSHMIHLTLVSRSRTLDDPMKELWEDLRRELSSPPTLGIVIIVIANSINASFVCVYVSIQVYRRIPSMIGTQRWMRQSSTWWDRQVLKSQLHTDEWELSEGSGKWVPERTSRSKEGCVHTMCSCHCSVGKSLALLFPQLFTLLSKMDAL